MDKKWEKKSGGVGELDPYEDGPIVEGELQSLENKMCSDHLGKNWSEPMEEVKENWMGRRFR